MGVVVVCSVLVLLSLVVIVRWGGQAVEPTVDRADDTPAAVAKRYVWAVTVAVSAGLASGVLLVGPGGRLAMRLLAATAGDGAQGKLTEAEEIVGRITVDGTIGFVVFVGLGFGLASAGLYMVVRRWLPAGRLGGLVLGALLLLAVAPVVDPLRKGNEDFDIVGPGLVAVLVFVALGLAQGLLVAAMAGRFGRTLPPFTTERRVLLRYWPLLLLLPLVTPVLVVGVVGASVVGLSRVVSASQMRSRGVIVAGRVALAIGAVAASPRFIGSVIDIAGRGPLS